MPNFNRDTDFDIDVQDFLYECDPTDIKEVIEWLVDNEDITKDQTIDDNFLESNRDWDNHVLKLVGVKHQLTVEEENVILQITKKL